MQIVSFRPSNSEDKLIAGFLEGGLVVASSELGYPSSVKQLFREHADLAPLLEHARSAFTSGKGIPVGAVHLGPPVPDPDKILCVGLNYVEHIEEAAQVATEFPPLFAKFPNVLIGSTDSIVMPGVSTDIDYEAELAIVIGTRCKNVTTDTALDYVAGYSVFNDVSARDLQMRSNQWTPGKISDTFGPMGPGITPRSEVPDVQSLDISTRVNGVTVQDSNTAKMIWPVAETVAYLSKILTLEPGDVIATGTPAGVGLVRVPPLWLKPGDVVEVEIEGLGLLRNPVAAHAG